MKSIRVTFQTLTPFWTGDAWRNGNELKLTGIFGSLRWWFEALVRGMGYNACDSTSENKCKVEVKNEKDVLKIHEKICPVCFLFGATGWKSRFSVEVSKNNLKKEYNGKVIVKINSGRGWHYEAGLMGDAELVFRYDDMILRGKDSKVISLGDVFPSILKILLSLIGNHGMLGAKTAMGYGVVEFKIDNSELSVSDEDWENFKTYLSFFNSKFREEIRKLPNLKDFFFVKFKVNDSIDNVIKNVKPFFSYQDGVIETNTISKWKDKNWCITSPVVRKEIRKQIKTSFKSNNNLRHFLMGNIQMEKKHAEKDPTRFSAIQVSHVYKNGEDLEFRIYGWLPPIFPLKFKDEHEKQHDYLNGIKELLVSIFKDSSWNISSEIQSGLCWSSETKKNNISLVREDMKKLFDISGGTSS
jgi:CRISPR-associated protein Cmr1